MPMRVIRKTVTLTDCDCVRVTPDGKTEHVTLTIPGKISLMRAASAFRKLEPDLVVYAVCHEKRTYACPIEQFLKIATLVERSNDE